jgi:hypothetical protein
VVTRLLAHTPVFRKVLEQIAFGDRTVRVHSELFRANAAATAPSTESDTPGGRGVIA